MVGTVGCYVSRLLLCVQGSFFVCEMLLRQSGTVVMHVLAATCSFLPYTTLHLVSDRESSQRNNALRAGRSGEQIPVGARLPMSLQTGPEAHPVSFTVGIGSFRGAKQPWHGADHSPFLVPRLNGVEIHLHLISVPAHTSWGDLYLSHATLRTGIAIPSFTLIMIGITHAFFQSLFRNLPHSPVYLYQSAFRSFHGSDRLVLFTSYH